MSTDNMRTSSGLADEALGQLHAWANQAMREGRAARLVVDDENTVQLLMKNGLNMRLRFDGARDFVARALVIMHQKGTISSATFIDCSDKLRRSGTPNTLLMTEAEEEAYKQSLSYAELRRMSKSPEAVLAGVRKEMADMRSRFALLKAAEQKLVQEIEFQRRADEAKARRQAQEELARVENLLVEAKKALQALDA